MKLRISAGLLLAATFALALWEVQPSEGQEAGEPASTTTPATTYTYAAPTGATASAPVAPGRSAEPFAEPTRDVRYFLSNGERRLPGNKLVALDMAPDFRQAAAALRDAKDDAAKAAAQKQLTDLLNNYFEEDMRRREEELAKIETRLKDLREQAARRREKKSEIVDLQIKVLLNEVEGLGFFSEARSTRSPLIPVEDAFKRRTWSSNSPYESIPTQAPRALPAAAPTDDIPAPTQPLGVQPSPK